MARTLANGSPHAFRNPAGRLSRPRAFHGAIRLRVAYTSSRVTSWLMLISTLEVRALLGRGLALGLGKKRYCSRADFSRWLDAGRPSAPTRSGSFGRKIGRKLRCLAHFSTRQSFLKSFVVSRIKARQLLFRALLKALVRSYRA